MLVLRRASNQSDRDIFIETEKGVFIQVTVLDIDLERGDVKIGIDAPREYNISRRRHIRVIDRDESSVYRED